MFDIRRQALLGTNPARLALPPTPTARLFSNLGKFSAGGKFRKQTQTGCLKISNFQNPWLARVLKLSLLACIHSFRPCALQGQPARPQMDRQAKQPTLWALCYRSPEMLSIFLGPARSLTQIHDSQGRTGGSQVGPDTAQFIEHA